MGSLFPEFSLRRNPRFLFVDMNSFFTSVEQQEVESYRGRPLIVVPVLAEHTCAIAVSYEARGLGVKTGTSVRLARGASPSLQIVEARPELYLSYHQRLVDLLHTHFATVKVLSIDEMACRLPPAYKTPAQEEELAHALKRHIARELGPYLRCSIGIAPNIFLAKVATEMQKPDGLTLLDDLNLPDALFSLKLTDLPGIGAAMKKRLEAAGISTIPELWDASPLKLRQAWGSVVGARWYYMLRGSHEADYQPVQAQPRKSVGHSNMLAPEHRNLESTRAILLQLFAKALKRLRAYRQMASAVQVTVRYRRTAKATFGSLPFLTKEGVFLRRSRKHLHAGEEHTWLKTLRPILDAIPDFGSAAQPYFVSIVFTELLFHHDRTLSLFEEDEKPQKLAATLDLLNRKYPPVIELAALCENGTQVPLRIPFGAPDPR